MVREEDAVEALDLVERLPLAALQVVLQLALQRAGEDGVVVPLELRGERLHEVADRHAAKPLQRSARALVPVARREDLPEERRDLLLGEDVHRHRVLEVEDAVADVVGGLGEVRKRVAHERAVRAHEAEAVPDLAEDRLLGGERRQLARAGRPRREGGRQPGLQHEKSIRFLKPSS